MPGNENGYQQEFHALLELQQPTDERAYYLLCALYLVKALPEASLSEPFIRFLLDEMNKHAGAISQSSHPHIRFLVCYPRVGYFETWKELDEAQSFFSRLFEEDFPITFAQSINMTLWNIAPLYRNFKLLLRLREAILTLLIPSHPVALQAKSYALTLLDAVLRKWDMGIRKREDDIVAPKVREGKIDFQHLNIIFAHISKPDFLSSDGQTPKDPIVEVVKHIGEFADESIERVMWSAHAESQQFFRDETKQALLKLLNGLIGDIQAISFMYTWSGYLDETIAKTGRQLASKFSSSEKPLSPKPDASEPVATTSDAPQKIRVKTWGNWAKLLLIKMVIPTSNDPLLDKLKGEGNLLKALTKKFFDELYREGASKQSKKKLKADKLLFFQFFTKQASYINFESLARLVVTINRNRSMLEDLFKGIDHFAAEFISLQPDKKAETVLILAQMLHDVNQLLQSIIRPAFFSDLGEVMQKFSSSYTQMNFGHILVSLRNLKSFIDADQLKALEKNYLNQLSKLGCNLSSAQLEQKYIGLPTEWIEHKSDLNQILQFEIKTLINIMIACSQYDVPYLKETLGVDSSRRSLVRGQI